MPDAIRFHQADVADLYRLTLDPARDPAFTAALVGLIGAPLPTADRPSGTNPVLIWQGPHDYLVSGLDDRLEAVSNAIAGRPVLFGHAGAGMAGFDVSGRALSRYLDRPGEGRRSRVMRLADLRVTAFWPGSDGTDVRLHVERSHAAYFRQWLIERWQAIDLSGK